MKRNALVTAGLGAMIALGMGGFACSSSSSGGSGGTTGSGGATGAGGKATGGATGSVGGATGSVGGATGSDAGQDAAPALAMCTTPAPDDGTACNSNPSCTKACGPNISALGARAQKPCICSGAAGTWSCPSTAGACVYPTDVDLTCLHVPTPLPACPGDPNGDGGLGLIRPNTTICTDPPSETCGNVCGSAVAGTFSYQDSTGAGKVGYCACVSGKYQCSSVAEWPTI
jgi:hypothetical protein